MSIRRSRDTVPLKTVSSQQPRKVQQFLDETKERSHHHTITEHTLAHHIAPATYALAATTYHAILKATQPLDPASQIATTEPSIVDLIKAQSELLP